MGAHRHRKSADQGSPHHGAEDPSSHRSSQAGTTQRSTACTCAPSPTTVADVAPAGGHPHHTCPAPYPSHVEHADQELQLLEVPVRSRCRRRAYGVGQPQRRHHRHAQGGRQLHQPDPDGHHRQPTGTHPESPQRGRHRRRTGVGSPCRPPLLPPLLAAHRLLHLDGTTKREATGRGDHGHRGIEGQGLRRGQAHDPFQPTSPATRGPSARWPRWSTSSATPSATHERAPSAPEGC